MKLAPPFSFTGKGMSLGIFAVLIWLFLWTQADYVFGPMAAQARQTMTLYFFLLLIPLVVFRESIPGSKENIRSLMPFILTFVVTLVVAMLFRTFVMEASIEFYTLILGYGLLYGFVKAYIEEIVFRWVLPKAGLGDIAASILFGLFHLAVVMMAGMAAPWWAIITLMGLGFAWTLVRRAFMQFGTGGAIAACVGSHFAYNIVALGLI